MTTINETVQQNLPAQYATYAAPVVTALRNREQQIVGQIIEFAEQRGLPADEARNVLSNLGMEVPSPPTMQAVQDPGPTGGGSTEQMLADIQRSISGLTEFARQNGYRG